MLGNVIVIAFIPILSLPLFTSNLLTKPLCTHVQWHCESLFSSTFDDTTCRATDYVRVDSLWNNEISPSHGCPGRDCR